MVGHIQDAVGIQGEFSSVEGRPEAAIQEWTPQM